MDGYPNLTLNLFWNLYLYMYKENPVKTYPSKQKLNKITDSLKQNFLQLL